MSRLKNYRQNTYANFVVFWIIACSFQTTMAIWVVGQEANTTRPSKTGALDPSNRGVDFAHDILPVLKSKCAKCHTAGVYKGGLSLESRGKLLDSGTVEIGDRLQSDLFERIASDDPEIRMPPEGEPLTTKQIEKFGEWIDGKLEWPDELSLKSKSFSRPLALQKVDPPALTVVDVTGQGTKNPIDKFVTAYFESKSIEPPARLSSLQFLRRSKLDLLGQLPTIEELELVANKQIDHEKLIDQLLIRNRDYADHWLSFWNDLLRNDYVGTGYIDGGRKQITLWLHRSLMENKPYDQFVRELINPEDEAAGFIKGIKWRGRVNASQIEPLQFSQNISQVFLGINMKCASCHDSFIDDWKLSDAYGLAAITSEKALEMHRCDVPTGKMATSKFVFPELGEIDQAASRDERLKQLAALMTSKGNGRFARTIVNRIWERMIGRGLVHPVDVMANEAWSEPLLDYLAMDLVKNGYDLKRTMKLIATSRIYNSVSISTDGTESNADFVFQGVSPKRLTAEQLVDSIWSLTDTTPANVDAAVFLEREPVTAQWIWSDENASQSPAGEVVTFRYRFDSEKRPKYAGAVVSCDNSFRVFLNGKNVGTGDDWTKPRFFRLTNRIQPGKNEILIKAVNAGQSANPAALFFQAKIGFGDEAEPLLIRSDKSWTWVKRAINANKVPKDLDWQAAHELKSAKSIYGSAYPKIESLIAQLSANETVLARASLVKSNDLMRSLGRPNREQVVTTRPAELSTLQALDLSNGETLTRWLNRGAKHWIALKNQNRWSDQEFVSNLFRSALSREPTAEEFELLQPSEDDERETLEKVEDLLWVVLMLPEFQFVK